MVYPETDLKFRISTTLLGFDPAEHNFRIVITDSSKRILRTVQKADCFTDTEGNYYFTLEDVKCGPVYAKFYAEIPDRDYNKQVRVITDVQQLCVVGSCSGKTQPCPCEHKVHYEQVWTVDIDDGTYLADNSGNLILVDNRRVRFPAEEGKRTVDLSMSGDDFKELIEGRNDDGQISTMPEVFDVMKGLPEDAELTVMTNQDVDDMMNRIFNSSSSSSSSEI